MKFSPKFYNEAWYKWDDMKVFGPTARHTRRFVFSLMEGLSFDSVLDAGCGTGILLEQIGEKYPQTRLTGFEYSPDGLAIAQKRLPNAEFYTIDLSIQSLDRKFDLITCIDVLEHINDDRAALKNILAMTAKYLILSVPLGPLFKAEVDRMGHVHGYGRQELEGKLRDAGFEILKVIQWGFPFYNIHRRIVNILPAGTSTGSFSVWKKFFANVLHMLFYLNLSFGGERYYVLCRPSEKS